jgi:hypothetical protein
MTDNPLILNDCGEPAKPGDKISRIRSADGEGVDLCQDNPACMPTIEPIEPPPISGDR